MFAETVFCAEEQPVLSQDTRSTRSNRRVQPWMCAIGLMAAVGCAVSSLRKTGTIFAEDEVIAADLNLLESQIRVQMDVLGVDYSKLGAEQKAFRDAVEDAIETKGKIKEGSAVLDTSTIISSSPVDKDTNPKRTEFLVKITVPMELSAAALIQRLNDDGDLLKDIKEAIEDKVAATTNVVVQSQKLKEFTSRTSLSSTDSHNPLVILDIDVKGVDYAELGKNEDSKTSFVNALRDGIVASQTGVEAKNIALDISNGGKTGDKPFVHVVAKIPVPEGLSADAFMSQWKGGHADIGDSVLSNVNSIPTLQQISRSNVGTPYVIEVATGPLHLGALRTSYASKIKLEVSAWDIDHDSTAANNVNADDIINKVQELLAEQAGIDREDVQITPVQKPATSVAEAKRINNPLRLQTEIYVHSEAKSGLTVDEWLKKLLPAGYEAQQYFKAVAPAATKDTGDQQYRFLVGVNEVSNSVETIDLDLVVHGIDYADLSAQRQRAFLSEFAAAVRAGLVLTPDPKKHHLTAVKDKIEVVVSDPGVKGAVNVRAKIPAPEDPGDLSKVMIDLEAQLDDDIIQKDVKTSLQDIQVLSLVTTWTPEAIHVSVPGEMDDFAGDLAFKADQQ